MISAKITQDSIANNVRIITYELDYHRYIHAELMTHRLFSRNAASSRAVPVRVMLEHITNNPAIPTYWGANQAGMSSKEELTGKFLEDAKFAWEKAIHQSVANSLELSDCGLHKQLANRPTEWAQIMKTVVTMTEDANWFWLRDHKDAQPEIAALAKAMLEAKDASIPMQLRAGDLHVPYVQRRQDESGQVSYSTDEFKTTLDKQTALTISASCCAQVSYRKSDDSLEKAKMVYDRLILSEPVHASPIEHQATPMEKAHIDATSGQWQEGITHVDRKGQFWSGNFRGWIQQRQLIAGNVKVGSVDTRSINELALDTIENLLSDNISEMALSEAANARIKLRNNG